MRNSRVCVVCCVMSAGSYGLLVVLIFVCEGACLPERFWQNVVTTTTDSARATGIFVLLTLVLCLFISSLRVFVFKMGVQAY